MAAGISFGASDPINRKLDVPCARRVLQGLKLRCPGCAGVDNGRDAAKSRHSLDQDFLPLAVKFGRKDADTCRIAAGPGQRIFRCHNRTDAYRRVRWSWRAATGDLELAALR